MIARLQKKYALSRQGAMDLTPCLFFCKKARQKPDFLKIYFGFYIPRIIDATRK